MQRVCANAEFFQGPARAGTSLALVAGASHVLQEMSLKSIWPRPRSALSFAICRRAALTLGALYDNHFATQFIRRARPPGLR